MRDFTISNVEKAFVLQALQENKRVDGRKCEEFRDLKISFGLEYGSCFVKLGNTKVFCQVSGEIVTPKLVRPTDGDVLICVEMSSMAAPHFESGRGSPEGTELCRLLERCIKEARCVDTESLCIIGGEKVWQIRVDVHIIDHDGGLIDCASVATMAALMHYRRPDITVTGEEFVVHSFEEKPPLPLNIYHVPICVTFGFMDEGKCILEDTSCVEEKILDGKMVIAMNSHREVCTMHCTGNMLLKKELLLSCARKVFTRVQLVTGQIKDSIAEDAKLKAAKKPRGFNLLIGTNRVTTFAKEMVSFQRPEFDDDYPSFPVKKEDQIDRATPVVRRGRVAAIPVSANVSTNNRFDRLMNEPEDDSGSGSSASEDEDDVMAVGEVDRISGEIEEIEIEDDDTGQQPAASTSQPSKVEAMEQDSDDDDNDDASETKPPLAAASNNTSPVAAVGKKAARNQPKVEPKPEPDDEDHYVGIVAVVDKPAGGGGRDARRQRRRDAARATAAAAAPADVLELLDDIEEDVMILQPVDISGAGVKSEVEVKEGEHTGNENAKTKRKRAHRK